jgi:tripartite-type tricarboxylate transporter receptor subunit TctC
VTEWVGIFAPANTPAPIIDKLNSSMNLTLKNAEVQNRLKGLGAEVMGGPPSNLDNYFRAEVSKWTHLAEKVKFEAMD